MNTIELAYQPFATISNATSTGISKLWIVLIGLGLVYLLIEANRANNSGADAYASKRAPRTV
jgi:hypothetical protein